ncbi:hypothetical protein AB835_08450 [Candidatus Endobugula sertula]|uniref:HDOD domain-containing protein n=1 Tax=Candidatus Endobugula sertula TaxID=62101 RepID=A0A1D2QPM0_9GAMM|nr:hypothetical protein AB835_08450 [Candidatus Endobugula sertula]
MPVVSPVFSTSSDTPQQSSQAVPSHVRLAIWLNKLPQNPLPIDTQVANRVLHLLKDEDCDSIQLAALIKQDPILCLKLFHYADNTLKKRDGDIQHLVHLLSLIGVNKLEKVIRSSQHKSQKDYGFQEVLSASLFAAHLSREFLAKKHGANNDRFHLPTLFFNAPLWLMWIAAPKTLAIGQKLVSHKQQALIPLCIKQLGFRLSELFCKSHNFVHLPEITYKALCINPQEDLHFWAKVHHLGDRQLAQWFKKDKTARHQFYSPQNGIYLLNQYVLAVFFDWRGKYIQRYSHLLCQYLEMDLTVFNSCVIDQAMNMRLPKNCQGLLSPINRLHGLHREPQQQAQSQPVDSAAADHAFTPPKPQTIESWLRKIHQSSNIDTALQSTLDALTQGVGVDHCLIMTVDDDNIHSQACYGFEQSSPLLSFHQQRNEPSLFSRLIQKPACISIQSQDLPKARKKLPQQFAKYCELQPCGLLSIFQHNQPKALIYCDQHQWSQQTHLHFKTVGKHLAQTLQQL